MLKQKYPSIKKAYDINQFKERAYKAIDMLIKYFNDAQSTQIPVVNWQSPEEAIEGWKPSKYFYSKDKENQFELLLEKFLAESNHLHSPNYAGHQVSVALPTAAIAEFVYSFLNNPASIYEMSPASYGIEQAIVCWMAAKLYIDTNTAGAVLTSGGSLGNLTALLAARQVKASYDVWGEGVTTKLAIIVSDQNHYSIARAAHIMGLGDKSIYSVKSDKELKMSVEDLKKVYEQTQKDGKTVIAICASACSTATGSYDPIDEIADFCEANNLWLHVDGAHGASVALSDKYKHLIKGINRADSVVWDAHKMMMIPSLITAVIYKKRSESYAAFSQQASYLLNENSIERDTCNRTIECTKPSMAIKLYLALAIHGEEFFSDYIDYTHDLAKEFAALIKSQKDFELALEPQSNIVCFRYLQEGLANEDLDKLQTTIREKIIKSGEFYFVQTKLYGKTYLRVSLMNPLTTIDNLSGLLELIRQNKIG